MFLTDLFTRCNFFSDLTRYILQMQHVHESDHIIGNKTLKIRLCKKKRTVSRNVKICTKINTDENNLYFYISSLVGFRPGSCGMYHCIILKRVVNN